MAREAAGGGVIRRSAVQAAPATSAPSRRGRREITLFESRDAPPLGAVLQRGAEAHGLALVGTALDVLIRAGDLHLRALAGHLGVLHVQCHLETPNLLEEGSQVLHGLSAEPRGDALSPCRTCEPSSRRDRKSTRLNSSHRT